MQKLGRHIWLLLPALCFLACADSPVTPPSLPEFDYPLSPGTRWWYSYSSTWRGGSFAFSSRHGNQIWEVAQGSLPNTVLIMVSKIDTSVFIEYAETTGVAVSDSQTSFLVSIDVDKLIVRWPRLVGFAEGSGDIFTVVPRYVESLADTLTISRSGNSWSWSRARYLSGVGLISWESSSFSNYVSSRSRFVLDSLSVR